MIPLSNGEKPGQSDLKGEGGEGGEEDNGVEEKGCPKRLMTIYKLFSRLTLNGGKGKR
jgi:hypothetical protein